MADSLGCTRCGDKGVIATKDEWGGHYAVPCVCSTHATREEEASAA